MKHLGCKGFLGWFIILGALNIRKCGNFPYEEGDYVIKSLIESTFMGPLGSQNFIWQ